MGPTLELPPQLTGVQGRLSFSRWGYRGDFGVPRFLRQSPTTSDVCNSAESIVNFVHNYSDYLLISCKDNRTFSFCQKYYLFKVSPDLKCKRFSRMPCTVSLFSIQSRCAKAFYQYHVDLYSDVVSLEQLIL